jgi:hypothetical protein
MPIERYPMGRSYTEREYAKADFADPEAVRTVIEEMMSRNFTVEGRVADLERGAIAYLQQEGMPDDPNSPCYGDPAWLRDNERWSLIWYAIEILKTIRLMRKRIERGDARLAADFALDLGVLATEAKFIQQRTGKQGEGGRAPREEAAQRHAAWRRKADKIWKRHSTWTTSQVARLVAKDAGCSFQTVRPVIADLNPNKKS